MGSGTVARTALRAVPATETDAVSHRSRCFVNRLTIRCDGCGRAWTVATSFSIYEQQAIESRPCPSCGSYTLGCCELADHRPANPSQMARQGSPISLPIP